MQQSHHQLRISAPDKVPPAHLSKLRASFKDNATRNLFHAAELCEILKAFDERGVEAAPFKGPTLALLAYGDLALRRFIDLDILVRKCDVQEAKAVLVARGYEPRPRLTPAQESVLLRSQHNLQFVRESGRLIVELHWEVVSRKYAHSFRAEDVWGRLGRTTLNGRDVLTLSAEDLLLGLCAHGTKHLWERLLWVCDVAELLNSRIVLNWGEVFARARAAGQERMLLLGVRLACELLGAQVPEMLREALNGKDIGKLSSFVRARLFDGEEYRQAGVMQNIRFNMLARRRWRDRARFYGFILSPTDGDIASIRLPAAMTSLYFVLRPFRLLTKGKEGH